MLPFDVADLVFREPERLRWMLWVLPAVVLLHLVRRRVTKRFVAHLPLWERALRRVRRRRPSVARMLLSLLLQLLIFATAIALWARPEVEVQRQGTGHTVLVVDRSLGTRALTSEGGDLAAAGLEIARALGEEALGRGSVALGWWRNGEVLAAAPGTTARERFDAALEAAPPPAGERNPAAVAALARSLGAETRVALISPFALSVATSTDLQEAGVALVPVPGVPANGGLRAVRRDGSDRLVVRVEQPGPGIRSLALREEGRQLTRVEVPASPDPQEIALEIPATVAFAPELVLLPEDAFPDDDRAPLVIERGPRLRVLVAAAGRTPFLDAWLRASELVDVGSSGRVALDRLDAIADHEVGIVVAETLPVPLPPGRWLLLGAVAPEMPLEIADAKRAPAEPVRHDDADPLVRALDLRTWRLEKAPKVTTRAGAQVVVEGSRGPLVVRGVAGPGDAVRFVWIAVPPDPAASTLPLTPAFPLILDAALRELAGERAREAPLVHRAGAALDLSPTDEPILRDREGRLLPLRSLPSGTGYALPETVGRYRVGPFDRRRELTLALLDHPGRPGPPLDEARPLEAFPERGSTDPLDAWFLGLLGTLLLLEWLSYQFMVTD